MTAAANQNVSCKGAAEIGVEFSHAVFSQDGKTLFAFSDDSRSSAIDSWSVTTGAHSNRFYASNSWESGSLAVSEASGLLAFSSHSMVRIWDLAKKRELNNAEGGHTGDVNCLSVTNSHAITASDDGTVRLWNLNTGQQRFKLAHTSWVRSVAFSRDGTRAASSSLDDTVCVWDTVSGQLIHSLRGHGQQGGYRALRFSSDGKCLYSWGDDFALKKWRLADGRLEAEFNTWPSDARMPKDPKGISGPPIFSPNANYLVLCSGASYYVFDTGTGKELRQIPRRGGAFESLDISPDSKWLLKAGRAKHVKHTTPDGEVYFSSVLDQPICIWELNTGKLVRELNVQADHLGPVAFTPNGQSFAVASTAGNSCILFYSVASGKELHRITGFQGEARSLAFTHDGKRLVAGLDDSTALVWSLPPR
jgi:hypothetical protein